MAIRFVHIADIHFGMENYGHIDLKTGLHTRLLDFKKSLDYSINFAIEKEVDFFVFAGDAYKNSHPTPTHQRMLLNSFNKLLEKNIPLIIVVGNHDHSGNFAKAHSLDVFYHLKNKNCYIFEKPQTIKITTKSGEVQIIGIPWPTRSNILSNENLTFSELSNEISNSLRKIIKKSVDSLDKNLPAVLVGHLMVEKGTFSGSERCSIFGKDPVVKVNDLALDGIDYVALGHLHRNQNLNQKGYPAVVYSGSIDRIDFGEIKDEKGFCYISINGNKNTNFDFIKIPVRPFFDINLNISKYELAEKEIHDQIKNLDLSDSIIRIYYKVDDGSNIETAKISRIFSNVWHIASIQCNNPFVSKKKESFVFEKSSSIEDLIISYVSGHPIHKENSEKYISLLYKYSLK